MVASRGQQMSQVAERIGRIGIELQRALQLLFRAVQVAAARQRGAQQLCASPKSGSSATAFSNAAMAAVSCSAADWVTPS